MGAETIWLPTFFKYFILHTRKNVIKVWKNMKLSEWWLNFPIGNNIRLQLALEITSAQGKICYVTGLRLLYQCALFSNNASYLFCFVCFQIVVK